LSEPKLCKDCKHFKDNSKNASVASACGVRLSNHLCIQKTSLVTGELLYFDAEIERNYGDCGKDGKLWEPKE